MAWSDSIRRAFGLAPTASVALRSEAGSIVGLDRPDERRIVTAGRFWGQRTRDEARSAEIQTVDAILRETADGRTSRFVDLCSSSRDRDSRLDAVARVRILATQGRPFIIKPPPGLEGDKEANATALWVTQKLSETRGFANLIGHLAHGTLYGVAPLEHQWFLQDGEWRTQPRFVHPNRIGWNVDDEEIGFYAAGTSGRLTPLSQYPSKFIVHNPVGGRSAYPWQRGAMRSRLMGSVAKRLSYRFWLKMLERWGQPQVFVTKPPPSLEGGIGPTGSDEDDDIIAGLRKLSDDWRAVIPHGASIETIAADVKSDLHEKFVAIQNLEDAVAILGQNLSTEVQGGSFAAAKAHQYVRLDVLSADLAELTETITDQWIRPLCEFNGYPVIPWIDWILAPRGEITVAHYQAGLYSADEVRASMGHDPEADNKGARYFDVGAKGADSTSTPAVDMAGLLKAIEVARGVGLQPTPESVSALFASAGLATQPIPGGTTQPKAITLAPTDIAKVVLVKEARASQGLPPFGDERDDMTISELDAKIAAEAERAKLEAAAAAEASAAAPAPGTPAPSLDLNAEASPAPSPTTPIEVGAIWTDTIDAHRLEVKAVEDGSVYLVDLDAEPNAHGQRPQFRWTLAAFRERCAPPKPT